MSGKTVFCDQCSVSKPESADFCDSCGRALKPGVIRTTLGLLEVSAGDKCSCTQILRNSSQMFCPSCGRRLQWLTP